MPIRCAPSLHRGLDSESLQRKSPPGEVLIHKTHQRCDHGLNRHGAAKYQHLLDSTLERAARQDAQLTVGQPLHSS
ncbi:MAG: hypothetical protein EB036_12080 [Betaproteobacteria bacterium]|nr:hypothetical protein [Betaproteobacteria bacterium]